MRGRKTNKTPQVRVNESIRVPRVRVLKDDGTNLGVLDFREALDKARSIGLDLVEITREADPPVVRMTDYGKFSYEQNKLRKERRDTTKKNETKTVQVKMGTGKDILTMRANNVRKWLDQGYTVNIDLFLFGRYRGMEESFLKARLESFLSMIPGSFSRVEDVKKGGKGYKVVIQPSK